MNCHATIAAGKGCQSLEGFTVEVVATEPLPEGQARRREALVRAWLSGNGDSRQKALESQRRRREQRLRQQVARLQQELQTLEGGGELK
jgi:hypothetical protein